MKLSKISLDQVMQILLTSKNMETEIIGVGEDNLLEKPPLELLREQ